MSDVLLAVMVVAFFLVAATVVWVCRRISDDAATETGAFSNRPSSPPAGARPAKARTGL